jgi:transposase
MLGPEKVRALDRPVLTSLETLVPASNFYRYLDAKLDLRFVRDWVKGCYAANGRPSVDPVVFFKLQLILFFEGLRSERRLIELASLNLAHRWYLGYHLDEPLPDHSSLTRIRDRLGRELFRRFFERVVELCQEAGLVWGKELIFDATKVRANAALDSLQPRLHEVAREHVAALFGADGDAVAAAPGAATPAEEDAPAGAAAPTSGVPRPSGPGADRLTGAKAGETPAAPPPSPIAPAVAPGEVTGRWDLLETGRLDPERPRIGSYQRKSDLLVSTTDPDATPMKTSGEHASLGYHDHHCIDGGTARVILQALVTPSDVMENEPMLPMLQRARFRWQLQPKRAIADSTYGTVDNIRALEEAGVRAYVPLASWAGTLWVRTPYYGPSRFTYDKERDEYRCPQDQPLRRYRIKHGDEVVVYRADAAACNACPLKAECTASDEGRQVRRSFSADSLDRVRGYHDTPAYAKRPGGTRRKRKVWIEPLFGEAKQWHGLRRFRLRGLAKVNIEGLLIATGQNLKRWLAATGWGRRSAPSGSLLAPQRSPALQPNFV